jgi:hypothetical protein
VRALRATIRLDRLSSWIRDTVLAIFRPESAAPRMVRLRACEPGGRTFESCRAHQPLGNQHLIKPRITAFSLHLNDGREPLAGSKLARHRDEVRMDGVELDEVEKIDAMLIAAEPGEPDGVIGDPSEDEADDDEFEEDGDEEEDGEESDDVDDE